MSPRSDSTPTVLVVDDERELADLYGAWLAERYEVHVTYGGEEALERLSDGGDAVDAVLLDRRMPDVSGDLLLTILRDRGYTCPVAMVTAVEPSPDDLGLGFDDYLVKPAGREELHELAESLLSLESLDSLARELSTLRVKRNVLRVECDDVELVDSERFADLERRIGVLEARIADLPTARTAPPADD